MGNTGHKILNFNENTFWPLCCEIMGNHWKLVLVSIKQVMGIDFLHRNSIGLSKGHTDWYNGFEICHLTFCIKV